MKLAQCRALVTGAAVRIGRAIVEALVAQGCAVILHYRRSAVAATELARRLGAHGSVILVQGDLAEAGAGRRIVEESWAASGGFNILINNAAVFHKDTLDSASPEKIDREWRVNFLAPTLLTRAFAEKMRACPDFAREPGSDGRAPRGKILHLLDRRVAGVDPACLPYEISKKMLADTVRRWALELAPDLAVNGIAPGAVLPPNDADGAADGPARDWAGPTLLRAPCGPSAVAEAALFLLGADTVTGQTIFVDNGRHLLP